MATQSIDRPLSTSPEFGNGALTVRRQGYLGCYSGTGAVLWVLGVLHAPQSHRGASPPRSSPFQRRRRSRRLRGLHNAEVGEAPRCLGRAGQGLGAPHPTLTDAEHRVIHRWGGAPRPNPDLWGTQQCLRRRPRRNSPPGSAPRATAISRPVSVTAAGRRLPATTSGSTSAGRGMLGERPRGSPWW